MITVRDNLNHKNQATIRLEVVPIYQLVWVEDHLEIKKDGFDQGILNVIAVDKQGRKFTNCTAV